jgi:hypothetical protein
MSPLLLGFVPSGTFYASMILNEPLTFWALFRLERFMLPRFQMSPLFLGFIPSGSFYAFAISNKLLDFGLCPFHNVLRFHDFDLLSQ